MGMPAMRRHWTTDQVANLQQESRHWPRYELIDGELVVTPSPDVEHQVAVVELVLNLHGYVNQHRLGTTLTSPADIRLLPESILQPDVFVVPPPSGPRGERKPQWSDVKALVLAVEIISPSSIRTDRIQKRDLYMRAAVPDYWVVDLEGRVVEQWSPHRPTPVISAETLHWHPSGAGALMSIDLVSFFQKVTGERII